MPVGLVPESGSDQAVGDDRLDSGIQWQGRVFASACNFTGERGGLDQEIIATGNGVVRWSISSRILTLRNPNGHVLTYRVRPSIYPDPTARTIISGHRGTGDFRLAVSHAGLVFEERSAPGEPWGVSGLAAPGAKDCLADFVGSSGTLAGKAFLFTWASPDVARVTTRATPNAPERTLSFYSVPGSTLRIAGIWTSTFRPGVSPVVFYGRHGTIIAQYPNGPC